MSMFWSQVARLATPYAVTALRKDDVHGWEHVFIMTASINLIAGVIFMVLGSGVEQPWAIKKETEGVEKEEIDEDNLMTRI